MTIGRTAQTWFTMAWKLAITLMVLNLIFEILENVFNVGFIRSFVYSPLTTLQGYTGISLPGAQKAGKMAA